MIHIDRTVYEFSHGKAPRGYGLWIFAFAAAEPTPSLHRFTANSATRCAGQRPRRAPSAAPRKSSSNHRPLRSAPRAGADQSARLRALSDSRADPREEIQA